MSQAQRVGHRVTRLNGLFVRLIYVVKILVWYTRELGSKPRLGSMLVFANNR